MNTSGKNKHLPWICSSKWIVWEGCPMSFGMSLSKESSWCICFQKRKSSNLRTCSQIVLNISKWLGGWRTLKCLSWSGSLEVITSSVGCNGTSLISSSITELNHIHKVLQFSLTQWKLSKSQKAKKIVWVRREKSSSWMRTAKGLLTWYSGPMLIIIHTKVAQLYFLKATNCWALPLNITMMALSKQWDSQSGSLPSQSRTRCLFHD